MPNGWPYQLPRPVIYRRDNEASFRAGGDVLRRSACPDFRSDGA